MNKYSFIAAAASAIVLTGCMIPEKFDMIVDFKQSGAYHFSFYGTVVDGLAAFAAATGEKLDKKDEATLKAKAEKMSAMPELKNVKYKGDGRFALEIQRDLAPGGPFSAFKALWISTDASGLTTIKGTKQTEKDKRELSELRIKPSGSLEVRLPSNAQVIKHNADSEPLFGRWGAYSWKFGAKEYAAPELVFKLKSTEK